MKHTCIKYLGLLLLMAAANLTYGQCFNKLYDFDTTADWGMNVFIKPDNTYMIFGTGLSATSGKWILFNANISSDGTTILNQHLIKEDSASLYSGDGGQGKHLPRGGVLNPIYSSLPQSNNRISL